MSETERGTPIPTTAQGEIASWVRRCADYIEINPIAEQMPISAAERARLDELFEMQWGRRPPRGDRLFVFGLEVTT